MEGNTKSVNILTSTIMNFNKIHIYFNKRGSSHKTQKLNTANTFQIYEFSEKNQDN